MIYHKTMSVTSQLLDDCAEPSLDRFRPFPKPKGRASDDIGAVLDLSLVANRKQDHACVGTRVQDEMGRENGLPKLQHPSPRSQLLNLPKPCLRRG